MSAPSPLEPVVRCTEFMQLMGLKETRFYELKSLGMLPAPLPLPGKPRWERAVVRAFLSSQRVNGKAA